jgi:hypothetical protein
VFRPVPTAVPPSGTLPHLRGVAAELLSERDGDGVHQMRAPGLDDVVELGGFPLERLRELGQRRD